MAEAWSAVPEWIRKAEADWAAASTLHSQNNEELHDAVAVSRHLASVDSDWQWDEENLSDLSTGAVLARYPGFETTADDADELFAFAGETRAALLTLLNSSA